MKISIATVSGLVLIISNPNASQASHLKNESDCIKIAQVPAETHNPETTPVVANPITETPVITPPVVNNPTPVSTTPLGRAIAPPKATVKYATGLIVGNNGFTPGWNVNAGVSLLEGQTLGETQVVYNFANKQGNILAPALKYSTDGNLQLGLGIGTNFGSSEQFSIRGVALQSINNRGGLEVGFALGFQPGYVPSKATTVTNIVYKDRIIKETVEVIKYVAGPEKIVEKIIYVPVVKKTRPGRG
jgi:hypothetical protein